MSPADSVASAMVKIRAMGGGSRAREWTWFNGASRPSRGCRAGPAMLVAAGSWLMLLEDRLPGSAEPQLALPPRPPGANLQIFLGSDTSQCHTHTETQTHYRIHIQPTNPDPSSIPPSRTKVRKGPRGAETHQPPLTIPASGSFVRFVPFVCIPSRRPRAFRRAVA